MKWLDHKYKCDHGWGRWAELHPQHEGGAAEHTDNVIMSAAVPEFTSALRQAASEQLASSKPTVSESGVSLTFLIFPCWNVAAPAESPW